MPRLAAEKEGKTNREERPISKAPLNLMFLWLHVPEPGADFLQACLSMQDKESKLCPWLLSLKLHLTEGFCVTCLCSVFGTEIVKKEIQQRVYRPR